MKKYFTKWLPVSGEITNESIVKYESRDGWLIEPKEKMSRYATSQLQKVKLFLCSRDIQIGDRARSIQNPEEEFKISSIEMGSGENYYPKELLVWNKVDKQVSFWRPLKNTFKVIGEISPDALSYVKEGDEFNVSDLSFYSEDEHGPFEIDIAVSNWEKWITVIKVKGPCGHFH